MKTKKISLSFDALGPDYHAAAKPGGKAPPIDNLSAAAWAEPHLWVASDETGSIERLTKSGEGFGAAVLFPLHKFFADVPKNKEADIEALAYDPEAKALWITSSHAKSRGQTEDATADELLDARPEDFELKRRRCLLGRVQLANGTPAGKGQALPLEDDPGGLRHAIGGLGGPFAASLALPAKENGLDVEGLAARGNALLIGLRGPTVGGNAVVLRAVIETQGAALSIAPPLGVMLLPLQGLAIRDLTPAGDRDAYLLAGPTFDLDAPFRLYRWTNAFAERAPRAVVRDGLTYLGDLTGQIVVDENGVLDYSERPEALTMIGGELLVLHDRPTKDRRPSSAVVLADMLSLDALKP